MRSRWPKRSTSSRHRCDGRAMGLIPGERPVQDGMAGGRGQRCASRCTAADPERRCASPPGALIGAALSRLEGAAVGCGRGGGRRADRSSPAAGGRVAARFGRGGGASTGEARPHRHQGGGAPCGDGRVTCSPGRGRARPRGPQGGRGCVCGRGGGASTGEARSRRHQGGGAPCGDGRVTSSPGRGRARPCGPQGARGPVCGRGGRASTCEVWACRRRHGCSPCGRKVGAHVA
jgi:hypothetical protein